jgi:hypothetical protein
MSFASISTGRAMHTWSFTQLAELLKRPESYAAINRRTRIRVAKVAPYYTITPESGEPRHRDVYHDHDDCSDGQRILPKHTVRGMGGHPKCDECKSLGKL